MTKVTDSVTASFTVGGTAASGIDYSSVTATPLTFGIGQATKNITVTLLPDPPAQQDADVRPGYTNQRGPR